MEIQAPHLNFSSKGGSCDIWPELIQQFLTLQDISSSGQAISGEHECMKALIMQVGPLTTSDLRNFMQVNLFLRHHEKKNSQYPILSEISLGLTHWANLNYREARATFLAHLEQYPADVFVLFLLHALDFCTGNTIDSVSVLSKVEPHIPQNHPFYGHYLAIKSLVLCESDRIPEALEAGLASYALIPDSMFSIHAVAHAYHELNQYQELLEFLKESAQFWAHNLGMAPHLYWHQAIIELKNSAEEAKNTFDKFLSKNSLDAVGFLWRYRLKFGEDKQYDDLWQRLAENWTMDSGTSISYFHDIHAAFAFTAIGKPFLIKKMISRSEGMGFPAEVHAIGKQILEAIHHYAIGEYPACAALLQATQDQWPKIGGSYAQRELLSLTLAKAHS